MLDNLFILPASFWIVVALLFVGVIWSLGRLRSGTGLPCLAVLVTVSAWYVGDVLYNDYAGYHVEKFTFKVLDDAWWQVALFLVTFLLLIPVIHRYLNPKQIGQPSLVLKLWRSGIGDAEFQHRLVRLFYSCIAVWSILSVFAALRLGEETPYYFFPFLGYKAEPWGRGRVGGEFDALLSFAGYFQLFVAGAFGVMAALIKDRRITWYAVAGCLMTWPYYFFDRSRNQIIAIALPAVLAWVFLRLRGSLLKKVVVLAGCFLLLESWMAFVLANRSSSSIAVAFSEKGFSLDRNANRKHEGLNMYEELCWINTFFEDGRYEPNWGQRYFAELVNPVPRGIWAGKPFVGIDYAIARGSALSGEQDAGVTTTISTGMIGQGIVNFGRFLGPPFAALLMAVWVAILARLDITGYRIGRIPLYVFGLILTFNLGRDITFITLYSFVFGGVLIWGLERMMERRRKNILLVSQPLTTQ